MKPIVTKIDLDTITFLVSYNQFIKRNNRDNEEDVRTNVREFLSTINFNCKAEKTMLFYQDSGHFNFRKYFYPDYKANRPPSPDFLTHWRNTILDEYTKLGAVGLKVIESDDALSIKSKIEENYTVIYVSADKDLNQLSGTHYNVKSNKLYEVTEHEATINLFKQILTGDRTDNIPGIYGIGDVKALKLLGDDESKFINIVHEAYRTAFQGTELENTWYSAYLKTKFLVSLLSKIDYNIYPFNLELENIFNPVEVKDNLISNLFNI